MANQALITQPKFDPRILHRAFPGGGGGFGGQYLQTGYMIWDKPLPGYGGLAVIRYLYNPSTVAADYAMSDASVQASLNYANPGDDAMLAIPISQTATWTLMFDRTFEVWQSYNSDGLPSGSQSGIDAGTIGVEADIMAFKQFTGMFAKFGRTQTAQNQNLSSDAGIMMQWPGWAFFGNNNVKQGLMFYGYISEWSVQYTHWTQYNVPMRAVVSVNWTMLTMPGHQPPTAPGLQNPSYGVLPTPDGQANPGSLFPGTDASSQLSTISTGLGGR